MQGMELRWDDVRVFLAVHRQGTLAGAARALKIDQTTVGRRLAALEEALQARLFDRTPDGLRLTPAGDGILAPAEQVEASVLQLERTASGADARIEGTVRLATSETLVVEFLMTPLRSLLTRYPQIALELAVGANFVDLSRREADVALRLRPKGNPPAQENVIVRKAAEIGFAVYASHDGDRDAVIDYDDDNLSLPGGRELRALPRKRSPLRVGSLLSMASAIRAGVGIGILPCFIADRDPRLARVAETDVRAEAFVLVHPDLRFMARVRVVMDALIETMATL
jgi:DNA-binding transcriptional LysR family regulator